MKKILAIAVALVMVMALSVSVFADDVLFSYEFTDNNPDGWWDQSDLSGNADFVAALQTPGAKIVVVADAAIADESGSDFGWQYVMFDTTTWAGSVMVHYNYDGTHNPDKGPEGDLPAESVVVDGDRAIVTIDAAAVVAALDAAGIPLENCTWVNGAGNYGSANTYSLTVVVPAAAEEEAPAEEEATAPAEETNEAPAATETPAATTPAPSTGLALAVVPAVMALAAVAVSKKH